MIGLLRGVLLDFSARGDHAAEALLDVGGVGYRVVVPAGAFRDLGEIGATVAVHVHTHVREDAIVLYGFASRDQRDCFEVLIAAHGIGPAVALAILSVHTPDALRAAVAAGERDAFTLVPGIGPKTAARLLVELDSRLGPPTAQAAYPTGVAARTGGVHGDVRAALAGLGYGNEEIRAVLAALPADGVVEDLLRVALRDLAALR